MDLNQAKEQIAKKEGYPGWNSLISALADDTVSASSDSFYQAAVNLVLSSKDKEIAELKDEMQIKTDYYEGKIENWKTSMDCQHEEWQQEKEKLQSELSQLKEEIALIKNNEKILAESNDNLREEMKKKEEQIKVLFGICVEKNCERPAVIDYNGHKHYVCQAHYDSLTRYFEEEYK